MLNEKQHAHQLLQKLDGSQLAAVIHLREVMLDPVAHSIANAPLEEEEITAEMAAELDEAHASIDRAAGVTHEEVLQHFGLVPGR